MEYVDCFKELGYEVYQPTSRLVFFIRGRDTIIATPLQSFILKYDHYSAHFNLLAIQDMIRNNEITNLADLITECQYRPGNNARSQMYGIEMVSIKLSWYAEQASQAIMRDKEIA